MSKDLLKEAIADAKAVRETAIANAKLVLEETFSPKIKDMISAHLNEMDDDDVEDLEDDDLELDETTEVAEDVTEVNESDDEDDEKEDSKPAEDDDDSDLELESIIRELEEAEDVATVHESDVEDDADEESDDEDDELDLDEILRELAEDDSVDESNETATMETDLQEAYDTIRTLKDTLNEVNILNAKLLFSNKLFRLHNLDESQKMRIIENFDDADTLKEIKLVYKTLSQSMSKAPSKKVKIAEGLASKPIASTKPKEIITESNDFSDRMKKLAGLI